MPALVLAAAAALSAAIAALVWLLLAGPDTSRRRTVANLQRGFERSDPAAAELAAAGLAPDAGGLSAFARRLTPGGSIRLLDRLLARAGRPAGWPLERLLAGKLLLGLAAAVLVVLYASAKPGALTLVIGFVVVAVAYFLPELLLHSRAQERGEQIQLELADTLDQMTIAVEAGLGFDSAMARAGKNGKGPLAEELVRTLQDIQVGQSRRQAYEALAARTDVADLRRFVRAVVQADTYGIAIGDVLRTQANEMRLKRRQRAEEKAMQIPVKVIFPLILCILPVLFIVLMGPAAMDIMEAFSG
ncbi:type II secretion system F family protein [Georgenia ruanii]|uniref:Type II secretion system F family protein n=1 Tax=Georgenia ruanii TaxID=348442 RepID=A0A7J9USI4_9MICO|nr:type II secretion system F family protein [Georgenia ruanii]MPV87569.1 type II secretion system F family protein [Georgenia ruanii]